MRVLLVVSPFRYLLRSSGTRLACALVTSIPCSPPADNSSLLLAGSRKALDLVRHSEGSGIRGHGQDGRGGKGQRGGRRNRLGGRRVCCRCALRCPCFVSGSIVLVFDCEYIYTVCYVLIIIRRNFIIITTVRGRCLGIGLRYRLMVTVLRGGGYYQG